MYITLQKTKTSNEKQMHPSWPQITNNINKFNVTPQLKARKGDDGAWLINVLKYFV